MNAASFVVIRGFIQTARNAEHMTVRVADVHLPGVPFHVGGRVRHVDAGLDALAIDFIHRTAAFDPNAHPNTLVFALAPAKGARICSTATTALAILTEKYLAVA